MSKLTWDVDKLVGNITRWTTTYDEMPVSMLEGILANTIMWYVDDISAEGHEENVHAAQHAAVQRIKKHREGEAAEATFRTSSDNALGSRIDAEVKAMVDDVITNGVQIVNYSNTDTLPHSVIILIGENGSFFQGSKVEFAELFGFDPSTPLTAMGVEAVALALEEPYSFISE